MHALHTACAAALLQCTLLAQGPAAAIHLRDIAPRYPETAAPASFQPFLGTGGQPLPVAPRASGAADLDGDRNVDLWFLGDGAQPGEIAIQLANSAGLGRFFGRDSLPTSNLSAVTTYRTKSLPNDQLLAVDPAIDEPFLLHWSPKVRNGDPRDGQLGGALSGWKIGHGVTEIAAADHSGDGHDDIVVLQVLQNETLVHKLVMDTKVHSYLWVEKTVTVHVPTRLEKLRVLDINGDGHTDFVAHTPGFGIIVYCDDGVNGFQIAGYFPTGALPIRDLQVGRFDGDRLDDIAVCFDRGIIVLEPYPFHTPAPWRARLFVSPAQVGDLHTCRILSADGKGGSRILLGFPGDGKSFVVHAEDTATHGSTPWVEPAPAWLQGTGVHGASVIACDVDNDADPDVVLQSPDRTNWFTLRNPTTSFAPLAVTDVDTGPAPANEGPKARQLNVTVDLPQSLIDANVLFMEVGLWVKDPQSPNPNDPDYLYWGRLMPAIDTFSKNASFSVFFDEDPATFEQRVLDYKRDRAANLNTFFIVYPQNQWETIRGGPGMFMSLHGADQSMRFESMNGNEPPTPRGSTLGGKWVLYAKPPSLKGDLDLLPWE